MVLWVGGPAVSTTGQRSTGVEEMESFLRMVVESLGTTWVVGLIALLAFIFQVSKALVGDDGIKTFFRVGGVVLMVLGVISLFLYGLSPAIGDTVPTRWEFVRFVLTTSFVTSLIIVVYVKGRVEIAQMQRNALQSAIADVYKEQVRYLLMVEQYLEMRRELLMGSTKDILGKYTDDVERELPTLDRLIATTVSSRGMMANTIETMSLKVHGMDWIATDVPPHIVNYASEWRQSQVEELPLYRNDKTPG